jgi:hypothetical protein
MKTQISNVALDVSVDPKAFADRFLDGLKKTDDFGQIVGAVSETETVSEFDTADIKTGQRNTQGNTQGAKGKSKRTFGKGKKVDVSQLLSAPMSRTDETTIETFADEIKSIHAEMLKGQMDQVKAFSEMGTRFLKIKKAVMIEKDFKDEKSADTEFGNRLKILGLGTDVINRPTRQAYIALAGKLTQAKSFVTKAVNAHAKDPKGVDKVTKATATDYAQIKLTAPVLAKRMGLLASNAPTKTPVDTLAKIVENVQNRVEKLEDVTIAQVIEALQKINEV